MATDDELGRAVEVFLDVVLTLAHGKDDDDLIFVDGFMRGLGEKLGIDTSAIPEIEPMLAGDLRRRTRYAKDRLARGEGPAEPPR